MSLNIVEIITHAARIGASDIHITAGRPPVYRLHGTLFPINDAKIKGKLDLLGKEDIKMLLPEETDILARQLMTEDQYERFSLKGDFDFSYSVPGVTRVRVNVFKQRNSTALVMRVLGTKMLSFKELGLPDILNYLSKRPNGLVLVTGPTGSGKSTTLASMIDLINKEKRLHIITLEDPIEYLHKHNLCIVNQREIGQDTESFAIALRSALREDPDVILVGEMRDLETISIAITAAETGHLVLATLHTSSAAETIDRIIDVFPPEQQQQIRIQLANSLEGIVAQQLAPRMDRPGRVAILEILVANSAIRNMIREGKTFQIYSQIQTGGKNGMQTLDASLRLHYQNKIISREEVINRARDPESVLKGAGV